MEGNLSRVFGTSDQWVSVQWAPNADPRAMLGRTKERQVADKDQSSSEGSSSNIT
jgi:hypothetical protein